MTTEPPPSEPVDDALGLCRLMDEGRVDEINAYIDTFVPSEARDVIVALVGIVAAHRAAGCAIHLDPRGGE